MAGGIKIMAAAPAAGLPGDIRGNEREIARLIDRAKKEQAGLLILPELCLSGAGCGDLFEYECLTQAALEAARRLAQSCQGLYVLLGLPLRQGKDVYSAMLALREGEILACWLRERPSAYTSRAISLRNMPLDINIAGVTVPDYTGRVLPLSGAEHLAVSLCRGDDMVIQAQRLHSQGASIAVFPAVYAALAGSVSQRRRQAALASGTDLTCVCINGGYNESSTDWVADGLAFIASGGKVHSEASSFMFEAAIYPAPEQPGPMPLAEEERSEPHIPYAPPPGPLRAAWCREAVDIAAHALRLRLERTGLKVVLLGLSGGLDSAMALLIAHRSFEWMGLDPAVGIRAVSLPGFGSSARTRESSAKLTQALGIPLEEIDIRPAVSRHFEDIGHDGRHDAAFENAQARERTQILMDLSNMHGGLMLGTGDLSELALGFATYGGDQMSMYNLNGGLYKSAIRLILRQLAEDSAAALLKEALERVLDTPVSPELLPGREDSIVQRTEDIVGPYELIDFYLHYFLNERADPESLFALAKAAFGDRYKEAELLGHMRELFRRFFAGQFKRSCMADGPQILPVSLSPRGGLEMPTDATSSLWIGQIDRLIKETQR